MSHKSSTLDFTLRVLMHSCPVGANFKDRATLTKNNISEHMLLVTVGAKPSSSVSAMPLCHGNSTILFVHNLYQRR